MWHLVQLLGILIFKTSWWTSMIVSSTHWPWSCQDSPGAASASALRMLRHTACRRCGSFSHRCSARRSWTSPAGSERQIHPRPRSEKTPGVLINNTYSNQTEISHFWLWLTFSLKCISTNLPKRLLLLFLTVFAFPKASRRGLADIQNGKSLFLLSRCPHIEHSSSFSLLFHLQQFSHQYPDRFHMLWWDICHMDESTIFRSNKQTKMIPLMGDRPAACCYSLLRFHTNLSTNLVFSVFPAPDSPETMIDWLIFRTFMSR